MTHAYIVDAIRTPFGRYGGALSSVRTDDLGAIPIKALMKRHPKVDWTALDEVYFGCANQAGEDNRNVARMALLLAGLPDSVPGITINRLCSSGLNAVGLAAHAIRCLVERNPRIDPARVTDVLMGCANQAGEDNRNVARMALLLAGLPVTVPGETVNRLCASGMAAAAHAARAVLVGDGDLYIAGGVESMTRAPYVMSKSATFSAVSPIASTP